MKAKFIGMLLGILLEIIQSYGGKIFASVVLAISASVRKSVLGSASTVDDAIVIPILNKIDSLCNEDDNT